MKEVITSMIEINPTDLMMRGRAYEEEINTVVQYFTKEGASAYEHNYWLSAPLLHIIIYTFDDGDRETEEMFRDYCYELLPSLPLLSSFTLSLFHEMGHFYTAFFEQENYDFMELRAKNEREAQYWYMRKPNETAATMWGLMKIMEEEEIVVEFDRYIREIREYYGI